MSALSAAVQREQWEVAAYLLLIGLAKVASRVPPEALAELLALLQTPEVRPWPSPARPKSSARRAKEAR